jgi:hypothetical protein
LKGEEAMKKFVILFGVFVCLILFFTVTCNYTGSGGGSGDSSGGTTTTLGTLIIKMKDKPVADADEVWVTINSIVVHKADTDEFIQIYDEPFPYDLYVLKDNPAVLDVSTLESGPYNQIRVEVSEGRIVFYQEDGIGDPDEYDLKIPSGEIKIPVHFEIAEGGTTEILLDFDAQESIKLKKRGNKDSYIMTPVIKVLSVGYPIP